MLSVLVVVVAATAVGFRPTAGPIGWVGALGLLALFTLTLTWLSVALGLAAKSPESASNLPMFLVLLPFLGSGFVPADSMPAALRWFAAYQPFTPVTESVRGLLLGGPVAAHAITAVAWSVVITVGAYVWSQRLFDRRPGLAST
jgi:ABC-2 type transport system permease protein